MRCGSARKRRDGAPVYRRLVALSRSVSLYRGGGVYLRFPLSRQSPARLSAGRRKNAENRAPSARGKARAHPLSLGQSFDFRRRARLFRTYLFFRARLERARLFRLSRGGVVWRRKLLPHSLFARATAGYAVRFLREDKYVVFVLFEEEEFCGELSEEEFLSGVEKGDFSLPLRALLPSF